MAQTDAGHEIAFATAADFCERVAVRLSQEIAAMPAPAEVVGVLERLVTASRAV